METVIIAELLDKSGAVRERHRFTSFPLRIGRGYGNALMLDDEYVAPSHGVIVLCDDGSLEYRDLGSENGSLLAGKPLRQHHLQADQTLVLGATRLRLRPGDAALLSWQPGWLAALAAATMLAGSAGVLAYGHQFNNPQPAKAVGEGLSVLVMLVLWAGVWALLGRLFVQRTSFRAHLLVAAVSMLLVELLDVLLTPLVPALNVVPGAGQLLQLLILLPLLLGLVTELRLATRLHRRQALLRVLGFCAAVAVIGGVAEYAASKDFDPNPDLDMAVQALPNSWLPASTPAEFFHDARDLQKAANESP